MATTIPATPMLAGKSATELVGLIRRGAVSARDVVDAHIARIEQVDATLNAVVVRRFDEARAEAAAADAARAAGRPLGPLHGLPITIKEQFLLEGTPTTFGFEWRRDHRADHTGPLVTALRVAGAIVLGKTNVGQSMIYHEADNRLYGQTRNPWDATRTPGGSSGGESAIIAAGGSPLGLGGDLGGSIRIPAHFAGIAGLKPTSRRLTLTDTPDDITNPPPQLPFQPGPLARDVADLHLAMSVLASASVGASDTSADAPAYPAEMPDVRGFRIAIQLDDAFFRSAPAIRRALHEAAADLVAAGATIVAFDPPPLADAPRLFLGIMAADGAWLRAGLHGEVPDRRVAGMLKAGTIPNFARPIVVAAMRLGGQRHLAFTVAGARPSRGAAFERVVAGVAEYRAAYARAMDAAGADIILSPPHALPALRHGASEQLHVANAAAYTVLYNVLGLPAGVVPVTTVRVGEESDRPAGRDHVERAAQETERGSAGLPVGVQVAARPWREDIVLSAMAALESAFAGRPDYPRTPVY
jgi:fatty acid amide hydrolase